MTRSINIHFALAASIIGAIAALWFILFGWLAMVLYLIFAAICMIPSVIAARRLTRQQNALDNRLRAAEHAINEINRQLNPEEK